MVKIAREIVLFLGIVLICGGLISWQHGKVTHGVGTESEFIDTQVVSPGSIIEVHTTSSNTTETRVIKLEEREAYFQNGTTIDHNVAAGGDKFGGRGTNVEVNSWQRPARTSTAFRIMVLDGDGTTDNIDNIEYTVEWWIWTPNYMFILFGAMLIFFSLVFKSLAKMRAREVSIDVRDREPEPEPERPPRRERERPPSRREPKRPPARRRPPEPEYPEEEEEYYPPGEPEPEPEPEPEIIREPPPRKRKPVGRIRCSACGEIIPLYSGERPMRVTCPSCGRSGTLR